MRVLIATVGGRGDVAPFTGLGTALRAAGRSATITSNDEYESLVVHRGPEFRPLPGTHGMFDDPRWTQASSGACAENLIRPGERGYLVSVADERVAFPKSRPLRHDDRLCCFDWPI